MELTMVKAQAYLKAGKTKKSEVLDDFCEGAGYCGRHAALRGEPHDAWTSPCGGRDTAASPPDESGRDGTAPGGGEVDISSARTLSYAEHSSGWQDPRSDVHGPSAGPPRRPPVDLVGRGGGQVTGDFGWTLTVTDCTTGRPQAGAVRTNTKVYVVAALTSCLRRYPGHALSLHADNGSEFINGHLTRFCGARGITFTRSRSYQGNDNPHVEEKNNAVIRTFVGYDRHDSQGEEGLLNRLYLALHLLVNWFLPSQKLLRGVGPGATSLRCTTRHRPRAHGCRHGRMPPNRRRNASGPPMQSWT